MSLARMSWLLLRGQRWGIGAMEAGGIGAAVSVRVTGLCCSYAVTDKSAAEADDGCCRAGGGCSVAAARSVKCIWTVFMQRMRSFQRAARLVGGGAVRRRVASGGGGIGQARRGGRAGPPPQARATAAAALPRDPHGGGNGGGNGGGDRDGSGVGSGGGGGSAGGAGQLDSRNVAVAREDTARRARRRLARLWREGLLRPLRLHERTGRGGREQAEAVGNRAALRPAVRVAIGPAQPCGIRTRSGWRSEAQHASLGPPSGHG
jgi:hypothetical protein